MQNKKKKNFFKIAVFLLCIVAVMALDSKYGWSEYFSDVDKLVSLKQVVEANELMAMLIYIVFTIIGCSVLALPGVTFALVAGILFGPVKGIFACLIATTLGAMLAFLVGRFFLRDGVKELLEKNALLKKWLFSNDEKRDLVVLMITRMVPLFPYNLQNFAYGVTDIRFFTYSVYTFIFMFPGVSYYTIAAAGLVADENKWLYFLVAGVLAVLVTVAGLLLKKKFLGDEVQETTEA